MPGKINVMAKKKKKKVKESKESIRNAKDIGKTKCEHGYYWPNNYCVCWEMNRYGGGE